MGLLFTVVCRHPSVLCLYIWWSVDVPNRWRYVCLCLSLCLSFTMCLCLCVRVCVLMIVMLYSLCRWMLERVYKIHIFRSIKSRRILLFLRIHSICRNSNGHRRFLSICDCAPFIYCISLRCRFFFHFASCRCCKHHHALTCWIRCSLLMIDATVSFAGCQ